MPVETDVVEYQTVEIGAAYLVKSILQRLGAVTAIDQELQYQPEIAATYGRLAQGVIFINIPAGIFWTGFNLAGFNLLLELAPAEARADSVALYQFMVAGAMVVGPLLGGYLADAYGFNATFGVSALGRLLGALAFLWWVARPVARQRRATLPTRT